MISIQYSPKSKVHELSFFNYIEIYLQRSRYNRTLSDNSESAESTMLLIWSVVISVLLCGSLCTGNYRECPLQQKTFLTGNKTIHCTVDGDIQKYYWYIGSTDTKPILSLEHGVKGGTNYTDGHYDITSDGELTITNAQKEHGGTYIFVVIWSNQTVWKQVISVEVTGFYSMCPLEHEIQITGNKTIHCTVDGDIKKFYWYLGSTETKPILSLEHGVKGGTNYTDGHYDITSGGEMTISNAQREHGGTYIFVVILSNQTVWKQVIAVQVTDHDDDTRFQTILRVRFFGIPVLGWLIIVSMALLSIITFGTLIYCRCSKEKKKKENTSKQKENEKENETEQDSLLLEHVVSRMFSPTKEKTESTEKPH
ncbi:uncharacterized protein [Apostichopus japonicus]|uniref:uncharacterized protein isoform X2 n=1 Tax=Stichopus japonicus TaxID=307972 RepID=UPI003AB62717